ncbi:MAG: SDR family oxidoreductase [Sphingomicrobium sp.]
MSDVTLITGASAGLGVEFARQLSARGDQLVLVARRKDRLEALARELGNARAVALDLAQPGSGERLMADLATWGETPATLINNAGFGTFGKFDAADPAKLRAMIDLNCGTLTDLCHAVAPQMIERRRGDILNVASTAAFQAGPGMAVYFATKAYVLSLSEALHEEYKPHGITVTCLCPGPTSTEFGEVAGFAGKGMFDKIAMDAGRVVEIGLKAMDKNRAVVVAGALNKVGVALTRLVPRALTRKIAGSLKL